MGNPAALTPVLDECVARDFVSFRGAFCQNPVCTPSRCSFMTGWYPHTRGHRTRDWKYVRRLEESDELYDLQNDPQELHNRIDDPALAPVRAQLRDRMLT